MLADETSGVESFIPPSRPELTFDFVSSRERAQAGESALKREPASAYTQLETRLKTDQSSFDLTRRTRSSAANVELNWRENFFTNVGASGCLGLDPLFLLLLVALLSGGTGGDGDSRSFALANVSHAASLQGNRQHSTGPTFEFSGRLGAGRRAILSKMPLAKDRLWSTFAMDGAAAPQSLEL